MVDSGSLDQGGFGWHVLRTLTESIAAQTGPYDATTGDFRQPWNSADLAVKAMADERIPSKV